MPLLALKPRPGSWQGFFLALLILAANAVAWSQFGRYLPYGSAEVRSENFFPYSENMLTPLGAFAGSSSTGPVIFGHRPLVLTKLPRILLTVFGCLGGAWWVLACLRCGRKNLMASPLLVFSVLQVPLLFLAPDFYDRYLLFLLPGAFLPAGKSEPEARLSWAPALGALVIFAIVSVCLMHDWLS